MDGRRGISALLRALGAAPPVEAVRAFGDELARQVDAAEVSFLIADVSGDRLVRLHRSRAQGPGEQEAEQVPLDDDVLPHRRVVVEQRLQVVPGGPVTASSCR